jgi:uncharacterized cupredoxin-like copper-binding protein
MSEHEFHEKLLEILSKLVVAVNHSNTIALHIMTALESLTAAVTAASASVTTLTTAVDLAITDLGASTPTDAQINAGTTLVQALTASVDALTARLNAATAVIVPPPAP